MFGRFLQIGCWCTCYFQAHSLQFQWELWEELATSEHGIVTQEFLKAQALWPKGQSAFGSFPGRCWLLLAYLLSTLLLKVQLWKPSWEQNFFKNECPHCSLICDDESLVSKYYSHKDFTEFYFMLNVYPLLANGKLNRAPCSGISAWRWNLRMLFELIVSEFCLHVNATHFGISDFSSQQTGKCGRSEFEQIAFLSARKTQQVKAMKLWWRCCHFQTMQDV